MRVSGEQTVLDAREIADGRHLSLPRARAWTAWEWCAALDRPFTVGRVASEAYPEEAEVTQRDSS